MNRTRLLLITLASLALLAGACAPSERPGASGGNDDPVSSITVYSGRNEKLILPIIRRFEEESGIRVSLRYGDTAELAATILEEGARTPADAFIAQDAGALGALAGAGMFRPLPADVLDRVPRRYRAPDDLWTGLSGRARTVVYNTANVDPESLPRSLEQVAESRYRGRFGLAPTNSSLQAHLSVYRVLEGEAATRALLTNLAANDPRRYPNNSSIVEGVISGEIDFGLVNHYYLFQARKERPDVPVANFFMPEGGASSFINLSGIGLLSDSEGAAALVRFLLSDSSQAYFANETFEYPVVASVDPPASLPRLDDVRTPDVDFAEVSAVLPSTLEMIRNTGLLR